MFLAVKLGKSAIIIEILLENGDNPGVITIVSNETPLDVANENCQEVVVNFNPSH